MRFKQFEIRPYNNSTEHYELVKWNKEFRTCYVIAFFDKVDDSFDFRPIQGRFLEDYEEGLADYILKYLDLLMYCERGGKSE